MSEDIPNIKAIISAISPEEWLAKLKRMQTSTSPTDRLEEDDPLEAQPMVDAIGVEPSEETGKQVPAANGENCDVWHFLVEPVLQTIRERIKSNPLLPVFLVENPYPAYAEPITNAIKTLTDYKLIKLDSIDKSQNLAVLVVRLTDKPPPGVILFCTSRTSLPREYRSLVRDDGYLGISAPTFERITEYASRCRQVTLTPEDAEWIKWIGPQELLVANILGDGHWREGIRQLARQRNESQAMGKPRKLIELYGIESAKNWATQLFNDLELARTGKISWNEVDKGAVFVGPPGTGKTTLARAIASESGVTFIPISPVKDWMTGNGLDECIKLMSATFSSARQQLPAIIFIDEIDSIGNRENFTGQNATWNTSFLNALLTEMDGFDERDQIIVIGATNCLKNVDAALLRAGRLDRTIKLSYPGMDALISMYEGMLEAYDSPLSQKDVRDCAGSSLGLTGADIEQILRSARRRARLDGNRPIRKEDVLDEIYHIPPEAKRRAMKPEEMRRTAYHEAGHALAALMLDSQKEQVCMASIIASDDSLGFVAIPQTEQNKTRTALLERLCVMLAGRAAEEIILGKDNVTTGAGGPSSNCDLAKARQLAEAYLGTYGFSEKHPNWHSADGLDEEASALVEMQYQRVLALLRENSILLESIARSLIDKHILTREELLGLVDSSK